MTNKRRFAVVVFGATGFTGRLVADYLAGRLPAEQWAIAGRNAPKLAEVKAALVAKRPELSALATLSADATDAAALSAVARETRVVCTTVGPYAQHGRLLAGACAEAGTSYCDLTGEVPFIRDSIDANDARAKATGARLVHCCGVDSIPSDLGTLLVGEAMRARGRTLASAFAFFRVKGGFSGGTIASVMNLLDEAGRDRRVRRLAADPYALMPDPKADRGPDTRDTLGVTHDPRAGEWVGPWIMATINARVVRRTNALLGFPWGKGFRYGEAMTFGRGLKGLARAASVTAGLGAFGAIAMTGPGRRLLKPLLPKPGEGPSEAVRTAGYLKLRVVGDAGPEGAPLRLVARVECDADPGYAGTAIMLGESALCLALDADKLPPRAGVLTPASAMGEVLVERLRGAGLRLSVDEARAP